MHNAKLAELFIRLQKDKNAECGMRSEESAECGVRSVSFAKAKLRKIFASRRKSNLLEIKIFMEILIFLELMFKIFDESYRTNRKSI